MSRYLAVIRLYQPAHSTFALGFGITNAMVLVVVFALTLAGQDSNTTPVAVYATSVLVFLLFWAYAIPQFFWFAVGLGVTRRTFYVASSLLSLVQALMLGSVFALFAVIERATDGWGLSIAFFSTDIGSLNLFLRWGLSIWVFLAAVAIGMSVGAAFVRWRTAGVFILAAADCVVLLALLLAVDELGIASPDVALAALTVILGGAGYLMLRRAPV